MKRVSIYALTHPLDGRIFYVGASVNVRARVAEHTTWPMTQTCKALKKSGLKPGHFILDECDFPETTFWENYWIHQLRAWGIAIDNRHASHYNRDKFKWHYFKDFKYRLVDFDGNFGWTVQKGEEILADNPPIKNYQNNHMVALKTARKFITSMRMEERREQQKEDRRKNNRGIVGKAGRKKMPDNEKKVNVSIYIKKSDVDKIGGPDRARTIALNAIEQELKGG